jgi:hypothetical protein
MAVVGFQDEQSHARLIEPIRSAVPPLFELVTPIPYTMLQQMFDASAPWGILAYEKAVYLDELTDAAIDVIVEHQAKKQSPLSFLPVFPFGGAYSRTQGDSTAFGGSRDIKYVVNISAAAPTPELFDADRAWVRAFWSDLVPHATGCRQLRQLHVGVRGEPRARRVRAREVRTPREDQGEVRPGQRVPPQREHSACREGRLIRRAELVVTS